MNIEVKEEQFLKAFSPIKVTVLGILIDVNFEQFMKVELSILDMVFGSSTEINDEQLLKAKSQSILQLGLISQEAISVFFAFTKTKYGFEELPK